jgi:hypothetical protein
MPIIKLAIECAMQETMLEIMSVTSTHAAKCDSRKKKKKNLLADPISYLGSFFVI